jgi:DNA-binding CsgD family transcriptional regulator
VDGDTNATGTATGDVLLTDREREVLVELTTGATDREISERLGISPRTAGHHSAAIYRKLGVHGRAEATAWAFRHGLVE